jgi:hypothetical protein
MKTRIFTNRMTRGMMQGLMGSLTFCMAAMLYLCAPYVNHAQFLDDGLRYARPNLMLTPRMGALGVAYQGVADDYGALYANPAGLTLLPSTEFTIGANLLTNTNTTRFYGTQSSAPLGVGGGLGHVGLAIPIRSRDGAWSFAFGYARESDFAEREVLVGTNPVSSMIQSWVANQRDGDISQNKGYRLFVADTVRGRFISPVRGGLEQRATTVQSGSLNTFSGGVGADVVKGVAVGASVIGTWGAYNYSREYIEADARFIYNRLDAVNFTNIDFSQLTTNESITHEISGVKAVLGVQAKIGDNIRVNGSATTPGRYTVRELNNWTGTTIFDNGDTKFLSQDGQTSFIVTTPWVFAAGISGHFSGLTLTGGFEFVDMRSLRFQSGPTASSIDAGLYNDLNLTATRVLNAQSKWGAGAEYEFADLPFVVRGSFTQVASPFADGRLFGTANIIGAGVGWYCSSNIRLDATVRYFERMYQASAYSAPDAAYSGSMNSVQVATQLVVRF